MTYDPKRQLGSEQDLVEHAAPFWSLIGITLLLLAGLAIWSIA